MCLVWNEGRTFTEHDEQLVMALSAQVGRIYELDHEISERKQAESALRHERDRAQQYLNTAEVILLALDTTARITLINRKGCGLLGWTADELLGRDWIETCLPVRIRDDLRTKFHSLLGGDVSMVENPVLARSGEERLIEWRNTVLRDDQGRVIGTFSSGADITERKRAEAELGQSERRKAAVLDSVLDCIVTMDAEGKLIELNPAAERTFGYTKAEAMGRALADLIIPPALRDAHAAGLKRYLATGEGPLIGKLIEVTAMRSDGSEIPVELTITAIRSDKAPIFTGVLRDMTARKQADETRTRLAAIVDSSDDAIFSMALDDTILTWNAGAERLYGYTASEVIGRSRALLVPPGESAERTAAMWAKALRGEAGEPFETQRLRKDGSTIDISLTISPMTDAAGRVTGASTIARDITGRKKAEAELKRLNDEIQLQRLRVFKATMRTVQDIVNNLLNSLQLVLLEAEGHVPAETLTLVNRTIQEASVKLKALGELETVQEKEMVMGLGIDYPGSA
jgi:PAS domain S-box-containing protein